MNTTYIIIALLIANLAVSIYYLPGLVRAAAVPDAAVKPDAQAKGAGGGGW